MTNQGREKFKQLLNYIAGDFEPLRTADWNNEEEIRVILERAKSFYVRQLTYGSNDWMQDRLCAVEKARALLGA